MKKISIPLELRVYVPDCEPLAEIRISDYNPSIWKALLGKEGCGYNGGEIKKHCHRIARFEAERRLKEEKIHYVYICKKHLPQFLSDHRDCKIYNNYTRI